MADLMRRCRTSDLCMHFVLCRPSRAFDCIPCLQVTLREAPSMESFVRAYACFLTSAHPSASLASLAEGLSKSRFLTLTRGPIPSAEGLITILQESLLDVQEP